MLDRVASDNVIAVHKSLEEARRASKEYGLLVKRAFTFYHTTKDTKWGDSGRMVKEYLLFRLTVFEYCTKGYTIDGL